MKQQDLASNPQEKFQNIIQLYDKIDIAFKEKGMREGGESFNLVSVGHEMMRANNEFYQAGVALGEQSFSTLATESDNKRDLAMSFLAMIYSAWTLMKKTEFNVLEIGAGSGDLMKEIFTIRNEVMASKSSSGMHKAFFKSLKFNIVDFPQMIAIQQKKLGENAEEVNFIEHDISKNLLPRASFDFIYGNEIPDTQRVDFLEVQIDKEANKKFFLRALKTGESGETKEVVAGLSSTPELISEIEKNLYPITELKNGVYKLQFGFHALLHNIKQSLKPPFGAFILTDYFDFTEKLASPNLSFVGLHGTSHEENIKIIKIGEPARQLIEARKMYEVMDVTYSPNVGKDICDLFDFTVTNFSEDDRSKAVMKINFRSESAVLDLIKDPLFGKKFKEIFCNMSNRETEIMPTEFVDFSKLIEKQLTLWKKSLGKLSIGSSSTPSASITKVAVSPPAVAKGDGGKQ